MSQDIEAIRRNVSFVDMALRFGVKLERDGQEYIACCPFHAENTASFTIFRGKDGIERMHCFGCDDGRGDVLDFVQKIKGVDLREAISILGGKDTSRPNVAPRVVEVRDVYEGIVPIDPPADPLLPGKRLKLYNPKRRGTDREWGGFAPSMVFPYHRLDGSLVGYVLRHEMNDGSKETPMVMFVRLPDGTATWCRFPFPKPRPLYGLVDLKDARQVIVVEGEKCRDALARATGRAVVSWPGGTQGARHCDWSPLAGRNVVIWPDVDAPGIAVANEIAGIVKDLGATPRVLAVSFQDAA